MEPRQVAAHPPLTAAGQSPLRTFALALVLAATGCGGPSRATPAALPADASPTQVDAARRALDTYAGFPTREFVFARDVYEAADRPPVVSADEATWLRERSEVYGVVVGDESRAYPIRLLAYHHVVNDLLGGRPVAITYCVVCSSGLAYDPVVDGETLTFGMDGAWRGVATIYDRESRSVWTHLTGACLEGRYAGRSLARLPSGRHTTWADWRRLHPATTVMTQVLDVARAAPGMGYDTEASVRSGARGWPAPMLPTLPAADRRLPSNALVFGVREEDDAHAYPLAALGRQRVVHDVVGSTRVVVFFDLASRSAAAFLPRVGDRTLSFRWSEAEGFRDVETGSAWTLDGLCTAGALAGSTLEPADGRLTEWFGWVGYLPETSIWTPAVAGPSPIGH